MKTGAGRLSLAFCLVLSAAHAGATRTATLPLASPRPGAPASARDSSPVVFVEASPADRHLFPIRDDKGLLMMCIAPEMQINAETDVFKSCTLAPGRTLDELMHAVVKAFHQERQEKAGASQEPAAESAGDSAQKAAQK